MNASKTDSPAPPKAATTKARKSKPTPPDTCRLTLHIRGTAYQARPFSTEEGRAVSLRKSASADPYTVAESPTGPTCDCGDQTWRHEGRDETGCKHIRACVAVGLISAAVRYTLPASAPLPSQPKPSRPGIDRVADEFDLPADFADGFDDEGDPSTWDAWTDAVIYAPTRAILTKGGRRA